MHNYGIFVAKIYDYALIDSFWGSAGLTDSPTSYAKLPILPITADGEKITLAQHCDDDTERNTMSKVMK